jgi:hypothetical protein
MELIFWLLGLVAGLALANAYPIASGPAAYKPKGIHHELRLADVEKSGDAERGEADKRHICNVGAGADALGSVKIEAQSFGFGLYCGLLCLGLALSQRTQESADSGGKLSEIVGLGGNFVGHDKSSAVGDGGIVGGKA